MKRQIISFIDDLKSNKKLSSFDEASTKQAIVLRLVSFLGWDIFNVEEVYPNYSVNSATVSYALRIKNTNKVFIEVKKVFEKLDSYQQRLVNFASQDKVNLAVLTNGITWWFYLITAGGSWQQKWFYSIDLMKQKPEKYAPQLIDLLTKNKVAKGQSLKTAKTLFEKRKQKRAADFLPEAWNKIISQPNKIFVELLSENTEKLCGHKVESKSIEKFLNKNAENWLLKTTATISSAPPPVAMKTLVLDLKDELPSKPATGSQKIPAAKNTESYANKSIRSFSFNHRTFPVRFWEEVLTILCEYFASTRPQDFEKVLWISDDQKPHFSRNPDQLRIPEKIKRTDIYVETKLNADEIVKTAGKLLVEFGYSKDDLIIDAK